MDGVSREMQQHEKKMGIGRNDRYPVLKESIFGDEKSLISRAFFLS